jgi:hypothetical protein
MLFGSGNSEQAAARSSSPAFWSEAEFAAIDRAKFANVIAAGDALRFTEILAPIDQWRERVLALETALPSISATTKEDKALLAAYQRAHDTFKLGYIQIHVPGQAAAGFQTLKAAGEEIDAIKKVYRLTK